MPSRLRCLLVVFGAGSAHGVLLRQSVHPLGVRSCRIQRRWRLPGGPVGRRVGLVDAVVTGPDAMPEEATEPRVSDLDALQGVTDAAAVAARVGRRARAARVTPEAVGATQLGDQRLLLSG